TVFEESSPDAIRNVIKINNCLGVVSIRLLEEDIRRKEIYVFTSPHQEWNRLFSFAYHKDKYLSPPLRKLQEIITGYDDLAYLHSLSGGTLLDM
ncbi:MAG TPA: LysR family transcriptional regulator, partial [Candidatus Blautia merdavium]|nr:LysR family transcriptional regulator [Candidatus Blautia merdavium]